MSSSHTAPVPTGAIQVARGEKGSVGIIDDGIGRLTETEVVHVGDPDGLAARRIQGHRKGLSAFVGGSE